MYIPNSFKENDPETLLQIMQQNSFATIVCSDKNGTPVATPLPFLIKQQGQQITLQAHFAKANPHWELLTNNQQVLVIFNGPHCYISPAWYASVGVPTWNYVTVHAYGSAKLFERPEQTAELIETLTDKYEQRQEKPWQPENNYSPKMLNAIVGFEINVQELQGKVKIGQNKSKGDLNGVLTALENTSDDQQLAIAELIKNYLNSKD